MMLIISASHLKVPLPAFTKEKYFSLFFSVLDDINFDVTFIISQSFTFYILQRDSPQKRKVIINIQIEYYSTFRRIIRFPIWKN